ncbi:MAG: hypothetical protein KIS92_21150 [Planctomycetota bacterium]|nr:hypothetical protein [Planctomycetota bacterium]
MKNGMLFALLAVTLAWSLRAADEEPFIVHEWGVMVRSSVLVASTNPAEMRLVRAAPEGGKPAALLSAPNELFSEMPAFVARHDAVYQPKAQYRDWNKPVIHFYGKEGLAVEARIRTPKGHPIAYYPKPKLIEETFWMMGSGRTDAVGMIWSGKLSKQPTGGEPKAPEGHWWNAARTIPGMYFSGEGGAERFIFWEASALQEPLVAASVAADALDLKNAHEDASGQVLVVVNDGTRRGWAVVKDVPGKGSVKVPKDEIFQAAPGDDALLAAARAQWESFGMTREEAAAIVEIWKSDLLASRGFLVVSRMPGKVFDAIFPLEVLPKPDALVRAGVVFDAVPGEAERIGWLPELKKDMAAWSKQLEDENFEVRDRAVRAFAQVGDLAAPVLEALAKSEDPNVSTPAKRLLANLQAKPMEGPQPPEGQGMRR